MSKMVIRTILVVAILFVAYSFAGGFVDTSNEEKAIDYIDTTNTIDTIDDLSLTNTPPFIANSYKVNGDIKEFSVDKSLSGKFIKSPFKSAVFGVDIAENEKISTNKLDNVSMPTKTISYNTINLYFIINNLTKIADITINLLYNETPVYSECVKLHFDGSKSTGLQNVKIQSLDDWIPIDKELYGLSEIENCALPFIVIPIVDLIIKVLSLCAIGGMVYVVVDDYLSELHKEAEKQGKKLKEFRDVEGIIVVTEGIKLMSIIIGNVVCDATTMVEDSLKDLKPKNGEYYFVFKLVQWTYIAKLPISEELARKVVRAEYTKESNINPYYNTWTKLRNDAAIICEPGNTSLSAIHHEPHRHNYYAHYHVADSTKQDGHVKTHSFYGLPNGLAWN